MKISYLEGNIKIDDTDFNESFSVDGEVDLTNFIKNVSDMKEKIVIEPVNFDLFEIDNKGIEPLSLKLIEYIYKILEAFNDSFDEVYAPVAEEDDLIF